MAISFAKTPLQRLNIELIFRNGNALLIFPSNLKMYNNERVMPYGGGDLFK